MPCAELHSEDGCGNWCEISSKGSLSPRNRINSSKAKVDFRVFRFLCSGECMKASKLSLFTPSNIKLDLKEIISSLAELGTATRNCNHKLYYFIYFLLEVNCWYFTRLLTISHLGFKLELPVVVNWIINWHRAKCRTLLDRESRSYLRNIAIYYTTRNEFNG